MGNIKKIPFCKMRLNQCSKTMVRGHHSWFLRGPTDLSVVPLTIYGLLCVLSLFPETHIFDGLNIWWVQTHKNKYWNVIYLLWNCVFQVFSVAFYHEEVPYLNSCLALQSLPFQAVLARAVIKVIFSSRELKFWN